MGAEYDINLSNGTRLATLYPLETNGPDNRSTPRQIQATRPTFPIVFLAAGVGSPPGYVISIGGEYDMYFPAGADLRIAGSTLNDGPQIVDVATYDIGLDRTHIRILGALSQVATPDGNVILDAFVLAGTVAFRFIPGFTFDIEESGFGSPNNNGTFTVTAYGAYEIVPPAPSNSILTVIPVVETITTTGLPLGQVEYTVPISTGSPQELNTSLKLPGKGTLNYGESLIEDLVRMTENFAADNSPDTNSFIGTNPVATPLVGQWWYNTTLGSEGFRYWDGTSWTSSINLNDGALIMEDPENGSVDMYLTAAEANLPGSPWVGTPRPGAVIWTSTNPPNGESVFRVLAEQGEELLVVTYGSPLDESTVYTKGKFEVQAIGSSDAVQMSLDEATGDMRLATGGIERLSIGDDGLIRIDPSSTFGSPSGYETLLETIWDDPNAVVNKAYIDSKLSGFSWKDPVIVVDDLSTSLPATNVLDGEIIPVGGRVLFPNVSGSPALNNIYELVSTGPAVWIEANLGPVIGDATYVTNGSQAGTIYFFEEGGVWSPYGSNIGLVFKYTRIVYPTPAPTPFFIDLSTLSPPINYKPTSDGSRLLVYRDGVKETPAGQVTACGSPIAPPETTYREVTPTILEYCGPALLGGEVFEFYALGQTTGNVALRREYQALGSPITVLGSPQIVPLSVVTYVPGTDSLNVYLNGQKAIVDVNYSEPAANSVQWIGPTLVAGDELEFYAGVPIVAGTKLGDLEDVDSNTSYGMSPGPQHGDHLVYNSISGVWEPQNVTHEDGTLYDEIILGGSPVSNIVIATNVTVVPKTVSMNYQQVFRNGVIQREGGTYTVTPPSTLTFTVGLLDPLDEILVYTL